MKINVDESLLAAYFKGETDPMTNTAVEEWYDSSPENRKKAEQVYYLLFVCDRVQAIRNLDVERKYREFCRCSTRRRRLSRIRLGGALVLRYAAAAVVVAAIVTCALMYVNHCIPLTVRAERTATTVVLPDGSTARLAPYSALTYESGFLSRNRKVSLNGEAYFSVMHRKGRLFVVEARAAQITVRGTEFNFKAHDDCSNIEAVLVRGAIDFAAGNQLSSIKPNQKVVFNAESHSINIVQVNPQQELACHYRSFDNADMLNVVETINRYYNSNVVLTETLALVKFSGTLNFDNSLEHNLDVITCSIDMRYRIDRDKIIIYQ